MSDQIDIAKAIATVAHKGQVDKAGSPYIDHPRRVAERLQAAKVGEAVVAAAWIHDVLEDTDLTRDDLYDAGLTWSVILFAEEVTRKPGQSVEDYYAGIQSAGAHWLKKADIDDNSDPARLALLDDETIVRLTRKYAKARMLLEANR